MSLPSFAEDSQNKKQKRAINLDGNFFFSLSPWFCLTYPLHTIQSRFLCVRYIRPFSLFPDTHSSLLNNEDEVKKAGELAERYKKFTNLNFLPLLASQPSPISLNKNFITVTINSLALVYNKEGICGLYRGFSLSILHMTARDLFRYLLLRYLYLPIKKISQYVNTFTHYMYRRIFPQVVLKEKEHYYNKNYGMQNSCIINVFNKNENEKSIKVKKIKSDENIDYKLFCEKIIEKSIEGKDVEKDFLIVGDVVEKDENESRDNKTFYRNLSDEYLLRNFKLNIEEEETSKNKAMREAEQCQNLNQKSRSKIKKNKNNWFDFNIHEIDGIKIFIKYLNELLVYPLLTCTTRLIVYEGLDRRKLGPLEIFDITYMMDGFRGFYGGFLAYIIGRSSDDFAEFLAVNLAKRICFSKTELYTLKACFSALIGTLTTPFNHLSVVQRCESNIAGLCKYQGAWTIIAAMPWKAFVLQFLVSILLFGVNSLALSASLKSATNKNSEFESNEES